MHISRRGLMLATAFSLPMLGLAACGITSQQITTAAQDAAAVVADLSSVVDQVKQSGTVVTSDELTAIEAALKSAQDGVSAFGAGTTTAAAVLAKINQVITLLAPYAPAVAALIPQLFGRVAASPRAVPVRLPPGLPDHYAALKRAAGG